MLIHSIPNSMGDMYAGPARTGIFF